MSRIFLALGAANAFLCVMLGALGSHGLKSILAPDILTTFQIGVQYHFYHAIGLILVGLALDRLPQARALKFSGILMMTGIVLFSGTLYVVSLTGWRGLGMVAPLGGTSYMAGWLLFAWATWKNKSA
ncbi:MAG TPA: DUF423 domain-containing protein [Nitrosomonas europaea]|uniref:DUF423 domain-containing protein n=1 Tax=Nitrosomonas europaea TaxID=915 RepID=UPI00248FA217|nr:DUF423 domain-containing protein [Nitrosomonas europaea]HRN81373.1 DUF423 domain-containing protein [Nitrosomonas europaea]HRO55860.1 DUF423 domain-containing protein [Nitrosomonas europaea]HRQ07858.1 DUF423 domain-containing protein [Nitrosomonas europaea]HUM73624.1 DUF423 domain-containing protein [Nitrosomonas europaea]